MAVVVVVLGLIVAVLDSVADAVGVSHSGLVSEAVAIAVALGVLM